MQRAAAAIEFAKKKNNTKVKLIASLKTKVTKKCQKSTTTGRKKFQIQRIAW